MYLYLTTTGRVTGQPREIEIWFIEHGGHFDLFAERESANWVRNIQSQPQVKVRVGDTEFNAIAPAVHNDREEPRRRPGSGEAASNALDRWDEEGGVPGGQWPLPYEPGDLLQLERQFWCVLAPP